MLIPAHEPNSAALNLVDLRDAISGHKVMELPAGVFDVLLPADGAAFPIAILGLLLRGQGSARTTLRAVGFQDWGILFEVLPGVDFELEGLTLEGPSALTRQDQTCFGVHCDGGGQTVRLRDVRLSLWNQCVKAAAVKPGGTRLHLTDCRIGGRAMGVLHVESGDSRGDECIAHNCCFAHEGAPLEGPNHSHNLYVNRGVALEARGCSFERSHNYGFLHYGGVGVPRFSRCLDNYFAPEVSRGVLTVSTGRTLVRGCSFECQEVGVNVEGNFSIRDCAFGGTGYGIIDDVSPTSGGCIEGCSFSGAQLYDVRRMKSGGRWDIRHCRFEGARESNVRADLGNLLVEGCEFYSDVVAVRLSGGEHTLSENDFHTRRPLLMENVRALDATLIGNRGREWSYWTINAVSDAPFTVRGTENSFYSGEGFLIYDARVKGAIAPRRGFGSALFDSGVLTISWNADHYELDLPNSPTIENIHFRGVEAGAVNNKLADGASVEFYAVRPFLLGTAGNVAGRSGVIYDAGQSVVLRYSVAREKWSIA